MNTIRSRGIMLNSLVRDYPVFMVLLWAILNPTLDVAHEYKGYPWRWRVLKQTFCSDLPSRKYVR